MATGRTKESLYEEIEQLKLSNNIIRGENEKLRKENEELKEKLAAVKQPQAKTGPKFVVLGDATRAYKSRLSQLIDALPDKEFVSIERTAKPTEDELIDIFREEEKSNSDKEDTGLDLDAVLEYIDDNNDEDNDSMEPLKRQYSRIKREIREYPDPDDDE